MALQQTVAIFATHALEDYQDRQPMVEFMALRRLTNEMADAFFGVEEVLSAAQQASASVGQDTEIVTGRNSNENAAPKDGATENGEDARR